MNWRLSTASFCRPVVSGDEFIHPVARPVVKWLARARAGCLACQERLVNHHMTRASAMCRCCGSAVETEEHMMAGCSCTGSTDFAATFADLWSQAASSLRLSVPALPPPLWVSQHRLPLLVAMMPTSLQDLVALHPTVVPRFLRRLHLALAAHLAERLRRRQEILAQLESADPSAAPAQSRRRLSALPPERQLAPDVLRGLEIRRQEAVLRELATQAGPALSSTPSFPLPAPSCPSPPRRPAAPPSGEPRRRWLRARLIQLLKEDTTLCSEKDASLAVDLLALFETTTGEAYADTPGILLKYRVAGIGKVMGNLTREVEFDPPLVQFKRRNVAAWNRRALHAIDVAAWRLGVQSAESFAAPTTRLRDQRAASNAGLTPWVKNHLHLQAADLDMGECSMALLLLWEVDHQAPFPSQGARDRSAVLLAFTRRLKLRVAADAELREWLSCRDAQWSLAAGVRPIHQTRWSVKIVPPKDSQPAGWYAVYIDRWQEYLASLVADPALLPSAPLPRHSAAATPLPVDASHPSHQRPVRRRLVGPRRTRPVQASPPALAAAAPTPPVAHDSSSPASPNPITSQPRDQAASGETPPAKRRRQLDLRGWFRPVGVMAATVAGPPGTVPDASGTMAPDPAAASSSTTVFFVPVATRGGHGRATMGPPT